ncbi:YhgE/Pip domain-containing protein [Cryobacterium algoritolerans]|uniref:YhgE/Pip domain-containing protein n=2 Tax=Cryobacterium algoritolerans TaxID=1259184 RepID=A0A4R8WIH6_9MICO|nr:YhgE/Pip domain-containing protein [Cryobacterium algoritolerans]
MRLERLFSRTPGQRRWAFGALLAGLIVVPLLVAGLFAGALASANQRVDTLPAFVVNNDTFVTTTLPDGSEQKVLAGRQLVTELTRPARGGTPSTGFAWAISNSADAAAALAAGRAYAVLTIPSDFSASVTSLGGSTPTRADLGIRTDDAHSYLAGSVAQSVGIAMTGVFGREITAQYLSALYSNLSGLGKSLTQASAGAAQVASGVTGVATGLDGLASGTASAASGAASASAGAASLSSGIAGYTGGLDALSSGLAGLGTGAVGLSRLSDGWAQYTGGVSSAAAGFGSLTAALLANPANAPYAQSLADYQAVLDTLAGQGTALSGQTTAAISGVQGGIGQSAAGASRLAAGSAALRTGANDLATGISGLSDGVDGLAGGTAAAASGAHQLEAGAGKLAAGLGDGAASASKLSRTDPKQTADVVSEPVAIVSTRDNPVDSIGPIIGMIFVPVGLWIGALAIFLVLSPLSATALASTAGTGRLVRRGIGRALLVAAAQAVVVVALLHNSLGVSWLLLPSTLAFAVFLAFVFVAVHHFLVTAFGRVGIVFSLVLLALQLTSVGGLYPIELVAKPFQLLSPFLPLTWAVRGMQAITAGEGGNAAAPAAVLALFALFAVLLSLWTVARRRGARSFGAILARG